MIRQFTKNDLNVVMHYTGRVIIGLGFTMLIPLLVAIGYAETTTILDFVISMCLSFTFGLLCMRLFIVTRSPTTVQAMLIAALSWLFACAFCAVPHFLSGHFGSFLDCYFDVMSGFTTTGLSLVQDLEHVSNGLNMWRHLLTYMGGQGIIVLALSFLIKNSGGAFKIMVGEGKDEALEPSIRKTAQNIWIISLVTLAAGTIMLSICAWIDGFSFDRGFFHSMWMFMSSWSTGGFAPTTQNTIYYHSFSFELVNVVFMILGSFNFALHYAVWKGNLKELKKNIELKSFFVTMSITVSMVGLGLALNAMYPSLMTIFRRGIFNVVSAHTGCGQTTLYPVQYVHSFAPLAYLGVCLAMMFGGSAASTAGGFKNMRIALLFKGIGHEIKKLLSPENAVVVTKFHHIKDQILEMPLVYNAVLIIIGYLLIYTLGAVVGVAFGYTTYNSVFESISAAANVGLSTGMTSPSMPDAIKVVYIFQMWIGRLEFLAVYVLFGSMGLLAMNWFKKRSFA